VAFVEEQIFYRVENSLNEDCFSINSFLFDVDASPVINPVTDQRICDDNNDGFWDLDLNMLTSVVLGSQNPADFEVTYHLSQADADSNTNPLPGTYTNATAYTAETIYIRNFLQLTRSVMKHRPSILLYLTMLQRILRFSPYATTT
jgi:hypothetical protein